MEGVGAQSPIKFCHLATLPDEIDGDLPPLLGLEVHDYALLAGVALGLKSKDFLKLKGIQYSVLALTQPQGVTEV